MTKPKRRDRTFDSHTDPGGFAPIQKILMLPKLRKLETIFFDIVDIGKGKGCGGGGKQRFELHSTAAE